MLTVRLRRCNGGNGGATAVVRSLLAAAGGWQVYLHRMEDILRALLGKSGLVIDPTTNTAVEFGDYDEDWNGSVRRRCDGDDGRCDLAPSHRTWPSSKLQPR